MLDDETESGGGVTARRTRPDGPSHAETVVRRGVGADETVDDAVVESVVDLCETAEDSRCDLEMAPMYETLDVDALGALYAGEGGDSVTVEFSHAGYRFTVTNDEIRVDAAADDGQPDR